MLPPSLLFIQVCGMHTCPDTEKRQLRFSPPMTSLLSLMSLAGKGLMESHSSSADFFSHEAGEGQGSSICSAPGSQPEVDLLKPEKSKLLADPPPFLDCVCFRPVLEKSQNSLEDHTSQCYCTAGTRPVFPKGLDSGSKFCYKSMEWTQMPSTGYGEGVCGPTVIFHRPHRVAVRIM